jgi:hypothetical protein
VLALARSAPLRVGLAVLAFVLAALVGGTIVLHNHDLVIRGVDLRARQSG